MKYHSRNEMINKSIDRPAKIDYNQHAVTKTNSVIFGLFRSGSMKYRAKYSEVSMTLNNCFLKMASNGRDAYLERLQVRLIKADENDIDLWLLCHYNYFLQWQSNSSVDSSLILAIHSSSRLQSFFACMNLILKVWYLLCLHI